METPSLLCGAKGLLAPFTLARAIAELDELRSLVAPVRCPFARSRALLALAEAAAALERRFLGPGEPRPEDGLSAGLFAEHAAIHLPPRAARKPLRPPSISRRRARIAAWFGQLEAALRLRRPEDVEASLVAAPGHHAAARGWLLTAMDLAERGRRTEARRALVRLSGRCHTGRCHTGRCQPGSCPSGRGLAHAVALLHARLDLEGGLAARAGRRVDALPGGLHLPPRAVRRAAAPRLPGEPEPLDLVCAREAMILRWRLGRLAPESRAARDAVSAWIDDPAACVAMFPAWGGDRGLAQMIAAAPRRRRAGLHNRWRSAFVVAHAGALAGRAELWTGMLADLRAAPSIDVGLALSLGALAPGAACAAELRRPELADAASPARAFFDEGLSMTPRRERKRTALVEAARASLSKLLAAPSAPPLAIRVAEARTRILMRVPGDRAAMALRSALRGTESPGGLRGGDGTRAIRWPLLQALVDLSPRRALELFVEAFEALAAHVHVLCALAESIEVHRLLVPGTGDMLRRAHVLLFLRFGAGAPRWLGAFVRAFRAALGALPGPAAFARVRDMDRAALPEDPRTLVAAWVAERDALIERPLRAFVRSLTADGLDALLSTHPLPFGRRPPPWDAAKWQSLLARLRGEIRGVARGPMRMFAAALGDRADVMIRLAHGAPPSPLLDRDIPLDDRGAHVLRCLDKRRDAVAFLRFADSVTCCFTSDSSLYRDEGDRRDTQFMILSLYRDPLSFCFQVRRQTGPLAEPFGFVFGSFALHERRPAVLLNGVYLRRQSKALRFAIVEAIERTLCAPLGIQEVAISSRYGGEGPLPPGYAANPRRVRRLRALAGRRGPATYVYDDISDVVNLELETARDVHWRTLPPAATPPAPGPGAPSMAVPRA